MLQFNFVKTKEKISYFFVICTFLLFLIDILLTKKFQIPMFEQDKYQFYIQNHLHRTNSKETLKALTVVKWNSHLENLIYVLSVKLKLHKLVLKPQGLFLYGYTKNMKAFNLFWEKLKLEHFFKSMKLIHWEQLRLTTWTYVIQIEF